jgi:hypothetical protein
LAGQEGEQMALEATSVFAIPIVKAKVPETEDLKRQFLPEILRRYESGAYKQPTLWETDRIHTSFEASAADQVFNPFPAAYENLLKQFIPSPNVKVQIWHNVYWKQKEYQEKHHHIPCHFSFIHFLSFNKNEHKSPIFYDPARSVKAYCRHEYTPTAYWGESARIEVEEGDALVFPSYLEHYIPPGVYTTPRVTVSMNVLLQSK